METINVVRIVYFIVVSICIKYSIDYLSMDNLRNNKLLLTMTMINIAMIIIIGNDSIHDIVKI